MVILYLLVRILINRRRMRSKAGQAPPGMPAFGSQQGPPLAQQQQGYFYPSPREDVPGDAPPAYGSSPGPSPGIPLQQYPSTQSLPQTGGSVQPRTMV